MKIINRENKHTLTRISNNVEVRSKTQNETNNYPKIRGEKSETEEKGEKEKQSQKKKRC